MLMAILTVISGRRDWQIVLAMDGSPTSGGNSGIVFFINP